MNALLRRTHRRASTRVVMFSVLTACTAIPLLSQCSPSIPQDKTIKIMPLGDSITESSEGHASYRYYLWQHLMESRSEEHTSELQSPYDLVCRLLLEKK